jgi:hypothetical protein
MFISCQINKEDHNKDLSLLDSGCNNHMIGNKKLFSSIDCFIQSKITLGDDYHVKPLGKGVLLVLTKKNEKKEIIDVFYVPNLRHNLIIIGQLSQNGYDVKFKDSTCTILDKPPSRRLVAKVQITKNIMFQLNMRNVNMSQSYAQNVSSIDETWLWHIRYGHLPFKSLRLLQKYSMVNELPILNE